MKKVNEQIQPETERAAERSQRFLEAWKKGIKLIGEQYFKVTGEVDNTADKWALKPNTELIKHSLHKIGERQAIFLAAMYSFYNSEDGQLYLEQLGSPNICDIAGKLEKEYLEVIAELFINYSGW